MDGSIVGRCRFGLKTYSVLIFKDTKYVDLCSQICSRFKELNSCEIEMTYAIGNHSACLLQDDMDVRVLHMSISNENKNLVDIDIVRGGGTSKGVQDYIDSSDNEDSNSTDENECLGKYAANKSKLYLSHEWKTFISEVGQKYEGGVTEFRIKLCKYAFEKGFKFVYVKNDLKRVTAECVNKQSEGCPWRVHATLNSANGFFYIKDLKNEHTCRGRVRSHKNVFMGSKIVSSVVADMLRTKPLIKPADIITDFKQNYGLNISYYNAWYGKELAKKEIHGDEGLAYTQLVWYIEALLKTNPGSHCYLVCDAKSSRFERIFISYHASIEGFKFCRPFLCLDGTFVKNKYKGHLLAATGKNGNQGFFPLAFAIVDSENEANWTWFLENLSEVLTDQGRNITFISDRCKGLIEAVSNVFPESNHFFCLHHLKHNVLARYPSSMGKLYRDWIVWCFSSCAYAPKEGAYEHHMKKLKKDGGDTILEFLDTIPKENWSNAFFPGKKYGEMCSNLAECFNSWILVERELPIYQLLDRLRTKMMVKYAARRRAAEKWTKYLCPKVEKQLQKSIETGRHWDVNRLSDNLFEVQAEYSFAIDLHQHACSCRQWQIKGFPCDHAIAAILADHGDPYEYIEPYFTTDYYRSCYGIPIALVPDIEKEAPEGLEDFRVKPPLTRKPLGRPRTKRIKSRGEEKKCYKCSRCGQGGQHNRRTCNAQI